MNARTTRPRLASAACVVWAGALLACVGCPPAGEDPDPAATSPTGSPAPAPDSPAGSPAPALDTPAGRDAAARAVLERVVRTRCLSEDAEPWAVVHGLLALGPDATVGGAPAIERLLAELDLRTQTFPRQRDGRLVEPHPGTFVKVLLELGVDPAHTFTVQGQAVRLDALVTRAAAEAGAGAEVPFHDQAWTLEALAAAAERDPALAARRDALRDRALAVVAENQAYLRAFLRPDAQPYAKPYRLVDGRPQPVAIHRYACGGLHLLQAVQRLHGDACPDALRAQHDLVRARLRLEGDYWDAKAAEALARFAGPQGLQHQQVIGSQQLKLLGHALETLLRAQAAGALPRDDAALAASLDDGFARLATTVLRLEALGVFDRLGAIRGEAPQVYLDLVGDSAHALHAYALRDRS